jgi:hypothetical protein
VPDEMKQVSDFLAKLETFPDLDVSIIRTTKINKVLKAILKLDSIPKEDEFHFKPRSQTLLDKWNILLASDGAPAPTAGSSLANVNGINGTSGKTTKETANGVKESDTEVKTESEKKAPKVKSVDQEDNDSTEGKVASMKDEAANKEVRAYYTGDLTGDG